MGSTCIIILPRGAEPKLLRKVPLVERLEVGKYGGPPLAIQLIRIEKHVLWYRIRVLLVLSIS